MFLKFFRLLFLSVLVFLCTCITNAQQVFIYDQETKEPVSDVFLYSKDGKETALTDNLGIADISSFKETAIISFQHTSYYTISLTKKKIERLNFKIGMIESFVKLNELVISASKWEEKTSEIPNKIEVIKRKDIIFSNPETTASMLESGGEVFVQRSQMGGGSPMLRGFAANKILFVVDGVRMNNAIYRSGNLQNVLQADVNSIESTEIIFGPGTNIYGSDALGGVIDIHMMNPKFTEGKKWKTTGNGLARISSINFEKTLHAGINASNDKWAFLAMFTYSSFEDLKMGSNSNEYLKRNEYVKTINGHDSIYKNDDPNIQRSSAYNQMNFVGKLSNKFSKSVHWTYNLYLSTAPDVPRYDRLIQYNGNELKYAEWNYSPQQWVMNSLELDFIKPTRIYDNSNITIAYQNVKEGRNDRKYQNEWLRERNEVVNIFSLNADFDKKINQTNSIFYGLEVVHNDVESTGVKKNIFTNEEKSSSSRYPNGGSKYFQSGAYLSYKKNFKNIPATFQAGARYSFVSLSSKFNDTEFYGLPYDEINLNNGALTASTGLVYRPGNWQLSLNLSSGFRAPNLDDVAKIFDSEPGNVVVPNEDLKPEYLYNAEIGISHKFQNKVSFQLSGFYSYLKDAMVRRDFTLNGQDSIMYDGEMSKVQAVVNAGYAHIYGTNLLVNIKLTRHLGLKSALTFIKGIDDDDNALRHAPPLYGNTTLIYERNSLKIELAASYNAAVNYKDLAPTERAKPYLYATDEDGNPFSPSWWTLNYRMSYSFTEKFMANFAIENILDKRFMTYSSGIAAPGRNIVFSVRYSF
jgi:hemoglobin/transferrin/lactoferrin receptor protein